MRMRDGFVSNSSSSSFVVVFPRRPRSAADVLKFMFNDQEGGVGLEYYDKGLSYKQIADKVFLDIDLGNATKGTFDKVVEVLSGRYHYYTGSLCGGYGNYDEYGGHWACERDRYCGFDKELMNKYRLAVISDEKLDKKYRQTERKLIEGSGIKEIGYAYKGGVNPYTKRPFTEKDVAAYEKSSKELDNFKKTDKKYLMFEKVKWANFHKKWETQAELRKEIAKVDAKNFFDDNKGKYVFIVNYGDEKGQGLLEHGKIFRNVPHIHISQH